jgi:hypothetical protein
MGIQLGDWSGSNATDRLRAVIEQQAAASDRLSRRMLWLTVATVVLAAVQVEIAVLEYVTRQGG